MLQIEEVSATRISVERVGISLLIFATIVPSYFFLSGYKAITYIYVLSGILFFFSKIKTASFRIAVNGAAIYILSLLIYSVQVYRDTNFGAGVDWLFSTVLVVLAVSNFNNKNSFLWTVDALIFISVPLLLMGLVEVAVQKNFFQLLAQPGAFFYKEIRLGVFRVSTAFGHPTVYCNYLTFLSALVIYRLSFNTCAHRKVLHILYILIIVNAFFTMSRSVLLILLAEQAILIYKRRTRISKPIVIGIPVIAMAGFVSEFTNLGVFSKLNDLVKMMLNVFSVNTGNYSTEFSSIGYTGVVGDRVSLFSWVSDRIVGSEWFGKGTYTPFLYAASDYREKTSIENYYLDTLFRHGYFGLIVVIVGFLGLIVYLANRKKLKRKIFDEKISFNFVMLLVLLGYMASLLLVDQGGEARLLYVLIGLIIAYNRFPKVCDDIAEV